MKRLTLLLIIAALAVAAVWAQAPVTPGAGIASPSPATYGAAMANPTNGSYGILVSAYITPYARVTAYDNWIDFGTLNPVGTGTYDVPEKTVANAGAAEPATLVAIPDAANADLAGIQIETNSRLDLTVTMDGWMHRVNTDGSAFAGLDTRKGGFPGTLPYQLKNQYKVALRGQYLQYVNANVPAEIDDGVPFASPTSAEDTAYSTWTAWAPVGKTNAIATDDGWLWPVGSNDPDAWSGETVFSNDSLTYAFQPDFKAVVERGQGQDGSAAAGDAGAAELWIAERVLRRGLQDISGNYRSNIAVQLNYRESPAAAATAGSTWN